MTRRAMVAIAAGLCIAGDVRAASRCLDGRFLLMAADLSSARRSYSQVIQLQAGSVSIADLCEPTAAHAVGSDGFSAKWLACGPFSDVVLRARIRGSKCNVLTGSVRATHLGKRYRLHGRAIRVEAAAPSIIPAPVAAWSLTDKEPFPVSRLTEVLVQPDRPDVRAVAGRLVALLRRHGLAHARVRRLPAAGQPRNSVLLTTEGADPTVGPEGYSIRVLSGRAILSAPTATGLFYACQSVRQLLPVEIEAPPTSGMSWSIPAIAIDDRPRFRWRGFMLDVSRTFFPIASLRHWVDLLALHKLNVFHLHLTDDQGWRVESDVFPALAAQASEFDPLLAPGDAGGYYTKADLSELVAYAAARHVAIVPEIEMPWHVAALLHALPALACEITPGVPRRASEFPIVPWGMVLSPPPTRHPPILCVCDPAAMTAVEALVDEITDTFPSRYVHLGGDEVASAAWLHAHLCPELIRTEGLNGIGDVQAWFSRRLEDILRARGRILVAWDDVHEHERPARPGTALSGEFTIMHWRRGYTPANLLDRDVIQAMQNPYYLDLDVPLYNTYAYEPVPDDATSAQAAHVLGVQASMWTHRDRTQADVERRVFPRLAAVAEVGWTPSARKDWPGFQTRWERQAERLDLLGVAR